MNYKATFTDGSELYFLAHYGIPKMQWGVRRYQNKDGSLTPEGREHYGVGSKSKSKSWVDKAANDPKHWRLVDDTPGERLYERIEPKKSSGRYSTGSKLKENVTRLAKELPKVAEYQAGKIGSKIDRKIDDTSFRKRFSTVEQRMISNGEKAKLINQILSEGKTSSGRISAVYNVLRSSVGDMSRHFKITARDLQTIFDMSYDGPDEPRLIMNDHRDFKKIFPGLNDKAAGVVQTYSYDAFLDRVNAMSIDRFSEQQKNGSRSDVYMISERKKAKTNRISVIYGSDRSHYIDASKNGCRTSVELTSNRKFTVNALDTLGFTNAEIAQKTDLSIGQVNRILYGYEID